MLISCYNCCHLKVLKIAINTISTFLFDNEMTVYLLVCDKKSYELSEKLFSGIESYIDSALFKYDQETLFSSI